MKTSITFNPPSQLPDADQDVLASILREDGSIEAWEAHCVDGVWWTSNSTLITRPVVSWADKPDGVDLRATTGAGGVTTGAEPDSWRDAVLEQLEAWHIYVPAIHDHSPRLAIKALVNIETKAALDPAVSSQAAALALQAAPAVPQGEPVAWMLPRKGEDRAEFHEADEPFNDSFKTLGWTPLYTAPSQPAVPGWKWVPVEPTREMLMAALDADNASYDNHQHVLTQQWKDMLAASPLQETAADQQDQPLYVSAQDAGIHVREKPLSPSESTLQEMLDEAGFYEQGSDGVSILRDICLDLLDNAEAAPAVPQGWKLVPVEPTEEMVNASNKARVYREDGDIAVSSVLSARTYNTKQAWAATLAAAPSQPSKYGSPELQALIVAHATQSQPVTLTDEELMAIGMRLAKTLPNPMIDLDYGRAIIAALREKQAKATP